MQEPSLDNWTIIFAVAAAQGIFLSIVLLKRKDPSKYLAAAITLFSLMLLYYVAFWTGYYREIGRWAGVSMGFTYLFSPLFYQYIVKNSGKINYLHFVPFLAYAVFYFTRPFASSDIQVEASFIANLIQCFHVLCYGYLMFKATNTGSINSLKKFIALSFDGYALTLLVYYILVWTGQLTTDYDYMISFASSILIYGTGYLTFLNPDAIKASKKYKNSALSHTAGISILSSLKNYMDDAKPYLDSELKLSILAHQLGFSSNHLSQVINEYEQKNFSDFINEYRIEEAKKLIVESTDKPKFIGIALDSGFNNKTSFNNAFKKILGCSPSEYYYSLKEEKLTA